MGDDPGVARSVRGTATVVLALALVTVAAGAALGAGAPAERDRTAVGAADPVVEADRTVVSIDVAANGTATWTIEYFVALETTEDEQAWADLESDVETNTSDYRSRFADRIRSTVAIAENDTGRQMTADRFRVETRTQPQFGVLAYHFRWTNFAVADDGRLRIGDAIDGYLLDEDTRMVISWPDDYTAETVEPSADATRENAVVWRGSASDFVAGEPRVVARAPGVTATATATPGAGTGTDGGEGTTAPGAAGGGSDLPLAAAMGLVGIVLVAALVWYGSRRRDGVPGPAGGADADGAGGGGSAAAGADADAADDAAGAAAAGAGAAAGDDDAPPEELLSNEERVLKLVRENGGRMKQQEVVDELDWTEAKTSQVVRGLRDDGRLEGFRLGRENVLKLPDEDAEDEPDI